MSVPTKWVIIRPEWMSMTWIEEPSWQYDLAFSMTRNEVAPVLHDRLKESKKAGETIGLICDGFKWNACTVAALSLEIARLDLLMYLTIDSEGEVEFLQLIDA